MAQSCVIAFTKSSFSVLLARSEYCLAEIVRPMVLIALTTEVILFRFKKLHEPFIILAAAGLGILLKLALK